MLVALDPSPRATQVLHAALALAESVDATVHVFRAAAPPAETASQDLVAVVGTADVVILPPVVSTRPPWQEILDAVERVAAEVIVIGSGARPGERVLGTTATEILERAQRPVLVVYPRRTILHFKGVRRPDLN